MNFKYSALALAMSCLFGLNASAQDYFFDYLDWDEDDSAFEEPPSEQDAEPTPSDEEKPSAVKSNAQKPEPRREDSKAQSRQDSERGQSGSNTPRAEPEKQALPRAESRQADSRGSQSSTRESVREAKAQSDHSLFVKRFGVGFFGVSTLPVPVCNSNALNSTTPGDDRFPCGSGSMSTPMVGARFWISERVGLDMAIGLGFTSLDVETAEFENRSTYYAETRSNRDDFTYMGGAFLLGLPIALANTGHFSFQFIPELVLGYARGAWEDDDPASLDHSKIFLSAWRAAFGARIGAEIHFGFMGLPQLALQGGVGIHASFTSQFRSHKQTWAQQNDVEGSLLEGRQNTWLLGTAKLASPWDIFTGQVSALYYF